jgi:hypothetical protein
VTRRDGDPHYLAAAVVGACKSSEIGPSDTGKALTLMAI